MAADPVAARRRTLVREELSLGAQATAAAADVVGAMVGAAAHVLTPRSVRLAAYRHRKARHP